MQHYINLSDYTISKLHVILMSILYVFVIFLFMSDLPQHSLILDVRTRWNSLYLMMERFLEQYPAIQAASLDQRLRKNMERDR
jgi:hypothetical protein